MVGITGGNLFIDSVYEERKNFQKLKLQTPGIPSLNVEFSNPLGMSLMDEINSQIYFHVIYWFRSWILIWIDLISTFDAIKTKSISIPNDQKIVKKRYYLDEILGKGVQGIVFAAFDKKTQKKVAVKIKDTKFDDKEQVMQEIKVLEQLTTHFPNRGFPELIDYCQNSGNYFVTELLGNR